MKRRRKDIRDKASLLLGVSSSCRRVASWVRVVEVVDNNNDIVDHDINRGPFYIQCSDNRETGNNFYGSGFAFGDDRCNDTAPGACAHFATGDIAFDNQSANNDRAAGWCLLLAKTPTQLSGRAGRVWHS